MFEMPEKLANVATQLPIFNAIRRVGLVVGLTFVSMLILWGVDYSAIDIWTYPRDYLAQKLVFTQNPSNHTSTSTQFLPSFAAVDSSSQPPAPHVNSNNNTSFNSSSADTVIGSSNHTLPEIKINRDDAVLQQPAGHGNLNETTDSSVAAHDLGDEVRRGSVQIQDRRQEEKVGATGLNSSEWVSVGSVQNYSSNLMSSMWTASGGEPCKVSDTHEIRISGFEDGRKLVNMTTGDIHQVYFQAVDEKGNSRCAGGDYFEIDLSSESWKSRPPLIDHGNGTYSFSLQVHPDFAGDYNLTIILLFGHFQGLKFSPTRFVVDKLLRVIPVVFSRSSTTLPELRTCWKSDFNRDLWSGRWTRHARNDSCEISNDGRFRCLEPNYPCHSPWCKGPLGLLESNGWVYSAHCSFKLFVTDEAWKCLDKHWILLWGDSNHVDTTRNLLFFFLGIPEVEVVTRRFDKVFKNPRNESQSVRFTNIFNGHWDDKGNYLGLDSLLNQGYRELLMSYFNGTTVPDTLIFNSGLHDGVYWPNVRRFVGGAERAASFFAELMEQVKKNGLKKPNFIFRSTVTTGGHARKLAFNPSKMEAFNGILLEKLKDVGLVTEVIDDFDMTWAWHFENRCNDGVHYGRFPAKTRWRDGQIGHQYFVDLMLGHVLLNAICSYSSSS